MNKKIFCFLLICILLIPLTVSAESEKLTKEKVFKTDSENFQCDFDKKIKVEDKEYQLLDINYTELEKTPKDEVKTVEKNIVFKNLKKRSCDADKQLQIEFDGQPVTVNLTDISYEKNTVTGRTKNITEKKDLGFSDEKPTDAPGTIEVEEYGNTSTLSLIKIEQIATQWVSDNDVSVTLKKYDKTYYQLGNDILIDGDNQTNLNGYEREIAEILHLDITDRRINSIKWIGKDFKKDGGTYRKAVVTVQKKSKHWQAVYSGNIAVPDKIKYTATAHYVGTVNKASENNFTYKVKATATYELIQPVKQAFNFMPVIVIGGCIIGIVIAIIFIYLLILKRKRRALGY